MLQQALFHPLVNAVKFNQSFGSIDIKMTRKTKHYKNYIELSIKNTGYGIPESEIEQLF